MNDLIYALAAIGAWTVISSAVIYLRDRSGNSGRMSHIDSNPRLDGPDGT
jgi:hypothetical protein